MGTISRYQIGKAFWNKTQGSQDIIATADKCVMVSRSKDGVIKRDRAEPTIRQRVHEN